MSHEIGLVFIVIASIIILFVLEVFPMDKIAFCAIGVLVLLGLVTPEQAISGFSNNAVITILCLMIIASALEQNGVITWLANSLKTFKDWPFYFVVPIFMLIAGSISAFISSTAVVIVFIKIITELSDKHKIPKSKVLLPISFASILGGSCTLMGTSTNLIVNSVYFESVEQKFSFFEFSWLGVIFLLVSVGIISLLVKFLPKSTSKKLKDEYKIDSYIATIELAPGSKLIGKSIQDSFLAENQITILKFLRNGLELRNLENQTILERGDRLLLSCNLDYLLHLKSNNEIIISSDGKASGTVSHMEFSDEEDANYTDIDTETNKKHTILVELMMLPGSRFLGKTLRQFRMISPKSAIPIAIKKRKNLRFLKDRLYAGALDITTLKVGDRILVEIDKHKLNDFDPYDNVVILQQHESPINLNTKKRPLTLLILLAVIVFAATGLLSILTSALLGCMFLLLFNCITLEDAYKKMNWQILFLLSGMIPLGIAMVNTGTDIWLSDQLLDIMKGQAPIYSLGILFLVTLLLSGVLSNNATAIIMAPLAIALSQGMNLPTKPFVLAVMFASNFSFFTPLGYQTNTLVYSMGIYRFKHFMILGGIVSVVLWILATILLNTMI